MEHSCWLTFIELIMGQLDSPQDGAYWASWALTHFGTLFLSCALCAAIGTYPFPRTPLLVMATLLWLAAAALLAFAYCLSTLFSTSRVAGLAAVMLYALAMFPGRAAGPPCVHALRALCTENFAGCCQCTSHPDACMRPCKLLDAVLPLLALLWVLRVLRL